MFCLGQLRLRGGLLLLRGRGDKVSAPKINQAQPEVVVLNGQYLLLLL